MLFVGWSTKTIKNTEGHISKDAIEQNNCRQVSGDKGSLLDGSLPMLVRRLKNNQSNLQLTWTNYHITWNQSVSLVKSKLSHCSAYLSQEISEGESFTLVMEAAVGAEWLWANRSTGVYYSSVLWKWPTMNSLSPTSCVSVTPSEMKSLWVTFSAFCFYFKAAAGYK